MDVNFIDIEFADKNIHKPVTLKDDINIMMGTMNYKGAVLASKSQLNEDEYEDEFNMQKNAFS